MKQEAKKWRCPFYKRIVDSNECLDIYLNAMDSFADYDLVKQEDREACFAMCEKCKKHGVIPGGKNV